MEKYVVRIENVSEEFKKALIDAMKSKSLHFSKRDNYFSLVGKDTHWNVDSHFIASTSNFFPEVAILTQEEFKKRYLFSQLKGG